LSFTMKVDSDNTNLLLINYIGADKHRVFDIVVNGQLIHTEDTREDVAEDTFYEKTYLIPRQLTSGQTTVKVELLANHGKTAGRVFDIRTIKEK
jgi:hypothetical protein